MTLISLRMPTAAIVGATLMAWRADAIAPEYSAVQVEMDLWVMIGVLLTALGLFWEALRAYQRMDRRYTSSEHGTR
jgi:hypothetical protein